MQEVFAAIVPVFLVVATGYGCTRAGLFSRADMSVLARFVIRVAMPLLIFVNVLGRPPGELFHPTYLLVYALAGLAMFVLVAVYGKVTGASAARSAFLGLVASATNSGFIGFPIFLLVVPEIAGAVVGMDMIVDLVLFIPLAMLVAERSRQAHLSFVQQSIGTVKAIVTHPLMIAIAAALVLSAAGVGVPALLARSIDLLAQASSGAALFSVGGMLVGAGIRALGRDLAVTVVAKLLLMPAAALGLVAVLPLLGLPELTPELRVAALITCALPCFAAAPAFAEPFGEGELTSAAVTTQIVVSFATITAWMGVLAALGWL